MSAQSSQAHKWGLNIPETLDIFTAANQGGRRYMEDKGVWEWDRDQVYIGLFDGHSGKEAAEYAADHLWTYIQCDGFESCGSDEVKKAVIEGFKKTHEDMWTVRGKVFDSILLK